MSALSMRWHNKRITKNCRSMIRKNVELKNAEAQFNAHRLFEYDVHEGERKQFWICNTYLEIKKQSGNLEEIATNHKLCEYSHCLSNIPKTENSDHVERTPVMIVYRRLLQNN